MPITQQSTNGIEYVTVTWDDIESYIDDFKDYSKKEYTGVYGIPRGGLVLAVMLSYRLGIPLLAAPCEGCLVADDISDSGDTLLHYRQKGYDIITVCCKSNSKVEPNIYRMFTDKWVVFPWEGGIDESK